MDEIRFPYRGGRHTAFLNVVDDSDAWANHDLKVDTKSKIETMGSAKHALINGEIEFVGGNHLSPYAERTRGEELVYVGQTASHVNLSLVTRKDRNIRTINDLRGRTVGAKGAHPGLNAWLYLKQNGLNLDEGDYELVQYEDQKKIQHALHEAEVDAALLTPPRDLFAERSGLEIVETGSLPMIHWTTLTTTSEYIEANPEITERFIRAVIEGIAYFQNNRERAIAIIQSSYETYGEMDKEAAVYMYDDLADMLVPDAYPTINAIDNAYREAIRHDDDARKTNPLEVWELQFLRRIADSGFVMGLYQ